jgi:hypothetical protein
MTVFALCENYYDNQYDENWQTVINLYVNQDDAIIAKLELDNICTDEDDEWYYFVKEMDVL